MEDQLRQAAKADAIGVPATLTRQQPSHSLGLAAGHHHQNVGNPGTSASNGQTNS